MGVCLSGCVRCATYCHDRYLDSRWDADRGDGYMDMGGYSKEPRVARSIHAAVIDNDVTSVRRIVAENEAARTELNSSDESPLHMACRLGYLGVMETLLEHGCPVGLVTDVGTPIHCLVKAMRNGYISRAEGLCAVDRLHRAGCDVNACDRGHKTALFQAAEVGNRECIRQLLGVGADVNIAERNQFTPLYMAVIRGDLPCVRTFLQCPDVDINRPDNMGRTPLVAALISITTNFRYETSGLTTRRSPSSEEDLNISRYNRIAIVEALLTAGADANVVDAHDRNALTIAFVMLEQDFVRQAASLSVLYAASAQASRVTSRLEAALRNIPESIYLPLVRLLVLSGARFPSGWQKNYSKCPFWIRQLYEESQAAWTNHVVQRPPKLVHLCRLTVRAHLARTQRLQDISLVPAPPRLREYLEIKYI